MAPEVFQTAGARRCVSMFLRLGPIDTWNSCGSLKLVKLPLSEQQPVRGKLVTYFFSVPRVKALSFFVALHMKLDKATR